MKILFYHPQDPCEVIRRADEVVGRVVRRCDIEAPDSFESLRSRLRRRIGDLSLAILLAPTLEEFRLLLSIGDLLEDTRCIFILPDREPGTVAEALKLRPRFLTFADSDFIDLGQVVAKMLRNDPANRPRAMA